MGALPEIEPRHASAPFGRYKTLSAAEREQAGRCYRGRPAREGVEF